MGVETQAASKFKQVKVPPAGQAIQIRDGRLVVPDQPIIPFIEGDGTGPDIWRASVQVFDAAVAKAYGGRRRIQWMEVFAGQKAYDHFSAAGSPTRRSRRSASTWSESRDRSRLPSAAASAR